MTASRMCFWDWMCSCITTPSTTPWQVGLCVSVTGFRVSLFLPGCHSLCLYFSWDGITWLPMFLLSCAFMSPYHKKLKYLQICWEPAVSKGTLTWIVLVEAVMLRHLKESLGSAMTNILWALQYSFSLKKVVCFSLVCQSHAVVWVCFILNSRSLCWSRCHWRVNRIIES